MYWRTSDNVAARVAGGLRELRPESAGVAVHGALAPLEREHHAGELLRDAVVQLLRDAPPFVRRRALHEVGGLGLLEHSREVVAERRHEVSLSRRIWRGSAPKDEDAEHRPSLGATDRRKKEVRG